MITVPPYNKSATVVNSRLKRSMGITMLLVLLLSPSLQTMAKITTLDFRTVDQLTYRFSEEKKWDSVIVIGKSALKQKIDYYFLRLRMGIAYYEKKQYFIASTHLKQAYHFNRGDTLAVKFLYGCYLYTNQVDEARATKGFLSPSSREEASNSSNFLDKISFESGYTFSSNNTIQDHPDLMGSDSLYGEQDLYRNYIYENLGFKLNVSNRVSISLAYSYLNFSKQKYFQYTRMEDHLEKIADSSWGKNYIYSFPVVAYDTSFSYRVNQHEAHIGVTWVLPRGFKIMPALHMVNVSYPLISASEQFTTVEDTAYYTSYDSTYHTFSPPFVRISYNYTQKDTSFNNYLAGLTVTKDLGIFRIGLSGSWSNFNGKTQYQAGAALSYYPLGNLNLYGTTALTGFFQKKGKRLLFSQTIGGRITKWCWLEANLLYGNYTNANIANGAIIFNNADKLDYRIGANMTFVISKHIQLSVIYQYFRKESQQYYYIKSTDSSGQPSSTLQIQNNPYTTNTIIGGITWKL